jgi:hypothetical protein
MVQTYGSGNGGSSDVVERPDQAALPDRRRDLLEGGGCRGGRWQARLLPRCRHGAPDFLKVFSGTIVNDPHRENRKNVRAKFLIYLKNKVKLKR